MFKFKKPSRPVTKVYIHCSASDNPKHDNVATIDAWHKARKWSGIGYHFLDSKDGTISVGRSIEKTPAAQAGNNRGSIAICLHGLTKSKFSAVQLNALRYFCLQVNEVYGGRVTFHGHCEVAAKACPVIDYQDVLKLDKKGRLGITWDDVTGSVKMPDLGDLSALEEPEATSFIHPTLRFGDHGEPVRYLQKVLKKLGYHAGALDGDFGKMTRTSVLSFQADNYLVEDAVVGNATYEAIEDAEDREIGDDRSKKTLTGMAIGGSRIAQASLAQGVMGTTFTAGGVLTLVEENSGLVSRLSESVGTYSGVLKSLGPWIGAAVVIGGLIVLFQAMKGGRARREDHRWGRTP